MARRLPLRPPNTLGLIASRMATPPTPSLAPRARQDCVGSCFKELQRLFHERLVVLEDTPMPGILIEDELGVRKAARHVDRVAAGHHLVVVAIRHQNRVMNARQIGRTLTPQAWIAFNWARNAGIETGLTRFSVRSFSRARKSRAAWRPLGVPVKKR